MNRAVFESWISRHCDYDDLSKSEIELAYEAWQAALESTGVKALRSALNVANEALEEISNEMIFGDRWTNAGQSLLDALPITRAALSQGDV
jgi:hypothetical protein